MTVRVRAFRLEDVFALRSEGDFTNLFRAPVLFTLFHPPWRCAAGPTRECWCGTLTWPVAIRPNEHPYGIAVRRPGSTGFEGAADTLKAGVNETPPSFSNPRLWPTVR